jgi:hypothetical protein
MLVAELERVAEEDAELLAAGKPLPVGFGDGVARDGVQPVKALPVV